ncbi:MAG: hypothetical protein M1360_01365 [Candidatus Marsarchaeota archaeon]|jgi:hypothetical protein|nr:hypothetical protein [Candidatus Marsarchaeota archaeon]MCL5418570.1 hypothetical protein [Candidatus Marsarchaeota archaeon]
MDRKLAAMLKEEKRRNLLGNLRYIDLYAEYVKKAPNREWSHRQRVFINSIYRTIPKKVKMV